MRPSIRTFLLINLLLSVTLITSLSIIGNLFLEHKELRLHLDTRLTQAAFTIESFITRTISQEGYANMQQAIDRQPAKIEQSKKQSEYQTAFELQPHPLSDLERRWPIIT